MVYLTRIKVLGTIMVFAVILAVVGLMVSGCRAPENKRDASIQETPDTSQADKDTGASGAENMDENPVLYHCPMHSHEHSEIEGAECPICGMKMVPVPEDELQYHQHQHGQSSGDEHNDHDDASHDDEHDHNH